MEYNVNWTGGRNQPILEHCIKFKKKNRSKNMPLVTDKNVPFSSFAENFGVNEELHSAAIEINVDNMKREGD